MNDQLKSFTAEHREAFDLYEPSPALWSKIETSLQEAPVKRMRTNRLRIIQAVAAAAVLAGIWFAVKNVPVFRNKTEATVAAKQNETPVQPQAKTENTVQPVIVPLEKIESPALAVNETPKNSNDAVKQSNPRVKTITPAPEANPLSSFAVNKNKTKYVDSYLKKNVPEMHNRFSEDLGSLQQQYAGLERSLKTNTNRDQIINAMQRNLEMQNELVNRQLNVIKEIKALKKPKNENVPTI